MRTKLAVLAIVTSFIAGAGSSTILLQKRIDAANKFSTETREQTLMLFAKFDEMRAIEKLDSYIKVIGHTIYLDKSNASRKEIREAYINELSRQESALKKLKGKSTDQPNVKKAGVLLKNSEELKKEIEFRY